MKKILSFIGVAAGVAVALIVSGCAKNNVKASNAENVNATDASADEEMDEAILEENDPADEHIMVLYGMPDMFEEDDNAANEAPYPDGEYPIMALYGMPDMYEDEPASDGSKGDSAQDEMNQLERMPNPPVYKALYGVEPTRFDK